MTSGTIWPGELADRLGDCTVFVALYSPSYFASDDCGREWRVFADRLAAQRPTGRTVSPLVPLLWEPRRALSPSAAVAPFHIREFNGDYASLGLMRIVKNKDKLGRLYVDTLASITEDVQRALAAEPPLPSATTRPEWSATQNAFQSPSVPPVPDPVGAVHAAIDELADAEEEARQIHREASEKIMNSNLPPVQGLSGHLRGRLADVEQRAGAQGWTRLAREITELERKCADAIQAARRDRTRADGLLQRRTELRGLLEALNARASRLNLPEDCEAFHLHRRAHDLLWTKPCDLRAATRAVRKYQQAITDCGEERRNERM